MKAVAVIYAARLAPEAFAPLASGLSAVERCLRKVATFPGLAKIVLLRASLSGTSSRIIDFDKKGDDESVLDTISAAQTIPTEQLWSDSWDKKRTLEALAAQAVGYDFLYFAWADCPLLDTTIAEALAERFKRYAAEYCFADGWPYGFAPELLAPGTASALAALAGDDHGRVERDLLFSVIQKDINAFDIETEISKKDLRAFRLSFSADKRRNFLLIERFLNAAYESADDAERFIAECPEALRTLPAFFGIQVHGKCPQACSFCPYPRFGGAEISVLERRDFMESARFFALLDAIEDFAGDAVIDLSLWGEAAFHPDIERFLGAILNKPALAAVLETSGIGWDSAVLERLAAASVKAAPRYNGMAPISWIISLDTNDEKRYKELRGEGFVESHAFAEDCLRLFPHDCYIQAVRFRGAEEDLESFYRAWKAKTANVIVQKYDSFHGFLPDLRASDLSPLERPVCWHLQRDISILLDGTVPLCREDLELSRPLGNVFTDSLDIIWKRGALAAKEHIQGRYEGPCRNCDEYYTYNF